MAIDYNQRYPDQTDTDSNYPQGKARNKSTPAAIDGFPFEEDYINDQLGFFQALLKESGIVPSGSADNANTSQYLSSIQTMIANIAHSNSKRNDVGSHDGIYSRSFSTVNQLIAGVDSDGNSIDMDALVGSRVYWRGYHEESDGGGNWGIVKNGPHTADGGSIFSVSPTTYVEANLKGNSVDVRKFGARADNGITDNRVSFQNTINFAEINGNTIRIGESSDADVYGISSFNPDTVSRNGNPARAVCLVISDPTNMKIEGFRDRNANIRYYGTVAGDALLYIDTPTAQWGLTVDGLGLDANNLLDYCIHASDGAQLANVRFNGGCYVRAVLDCIKMAAYMVTMSRVLLSDVGRYGLHFAGNFDNDTEGETTSLNIENCWVRLVGEAGYKVSNDLWYSTFNATGCDGLGDTGTQFRPRWAFDFHRARGVSVIGCGAENCDSYLNADLHFGLEIVSPVGIGLGATTGTVPALIQLGGDGGCTITNAPYGFDLFTGVDYTVEIDKINSRTRLDLIGLGIDRNRVNVLNDDNTPTVFFNSGSGYARDSGFQRIQDTIYVNKNTELQPRDTVSGRYSLARKGCLVDFSGTVDTDPVPILKVTAGGGGTISVQVTDVITKIAGSPTPATSCVTAMGSAMWRSANGYNHEMSISDPTSSVTANLEWVGDTLYITHNSQWSFHVIDIDVFSRNEGIYVEMLI